MPRSKRMIGPHMALHVMCRGNNREGVFHEDGDKEKYYELLNEHREDNRIQIYHYCLMDNHIHLITWLGEAARFARYMKQVNLCYVHYYRRKYGFWGHFWQDRPKSIIVDTDEYLLQCGKYIELNPVRAGMVKEVGEYRFSSYRYYAFGEADRLLSPDPVYSGLSDDIMTRRERYIDFVIDEDRINGERLGKLNYLGSEAFMRRMQEWCGLQSERRKRGRPWKKGK